MQNKEYLINIVKGMNKKIYEFAFKMKENYVFQVC